MRAVWDYFLPAYNCPLKEKIGIDPILGDNGKWLCGVRTLLQRPGCVIYSFGCADFATSCSPEQFKLPFQPAMELPRWPCNSAHHCISQDALPASSGSLSTFTSDLMTCSTMHGSSLEPSHSDDAMPSQSIGLQARLRPMYSTSAWCTF